MLEVQTLLQHLCNTLQLVKRMNNKNRGTGSEQSVDH
jgi:hypothetical protein